MNVYFKILFTISFVTIQFTASAQSFRENENGLKYAELYQGKGAKCKVGDLVTMDMVIKSGNFEIRNSYKEGKSILFPVKNSVFKGDIYEAVALMKEGDSTLFMIQTDSLYEKVFRKEKPKEVKTSLLEVVIKVHKTRTQQAYLEEQKSTYNQQKKPADTEAKKRLAEETIQIEKYIKTIGGNFLKSPKGVYYSIIKEGETSLLKGDAVIFHYTGKIMGDKNFESTYEIGHPISFTLGENNVIEGWEDVFPLLKLGTSVKMIIPSHLAFKNLSKNEIIKPHSILEFDVQVIGKR